MPKDKRIYITLAVDMPDHPKLAALTKGQCWLIVEALMYCRNYKTDGVIDAAVWRKMDTKRNREAVEQSRVGINLATESRQDFDKIAAEFRQKTGAALPNSGVFFPDYAEHQQTRADIEAATAAKKAAGSKGGKARAANASYPKPDPEEASEGQAAACDPLKQTLKQNQAEVEVEEEKELSTHLSTPPHVSNAPAKRRRGLQAIDAANATARFPAVHAFMHDYVQASATPIDQKTFAQIEDAITPLIAQGIPGQQVANGIRAWEASDSFSPTQIAAFVHKAGAKASAPSGQGKPTTKALGHLASAERLIQARRNA
ncbi:hypothetical protein [Rhodococcus sp. UNC363MFTsu5.1]|uniref:hypothetical protein n=1 Tax=Rhodococcus sp. UNC363MFTsu5.1 TaxID=1449069 RepID=UPI00068A2668|nr:hypothetical protein [Rhodococcus sp. UNC363MFTsu5.1]